jgi:hypothetical protein
MGDPIQELLKQYGSGDVNIEQLIAQYAGGGDPYAIFTGGVDANSQVGVSANVLPRRPGPPIGDSGRQRAPGVATVNITYDKVGEVLKAFYRLGPDGLRRMQALLFAGGFYGANVNLTDIPWGVADEASFSAWAQAVARAARMNAAGQDVTYQQVIGNAAESAGLDMKDLEKALEGTDADLENLLSATMPGDVFTVALSDPAGLRSTLDRTASAVLGRKANPAEQRMFISMIHGMQREGQLTQQRGAAAAQSIAQAGMFGGAAEAAGFGDETTPPGDQVVTYSLPDVEGQAEEALRNANPAEAGAHDIAAQFANFLEIMKGPISMPHVTIGG